MTRGKYFVEINRYAMLKKNGLSPEQEQFLNLVVKPARQTPEQAAWYLGFPPHDIPMLVKRNLLKWLGNPPANGIKHIATVVLDRLRSDERWLARATDATHERWHRKNSKSRLSPGDQSSPDKLRHN